MVAIIALENAALMLGQGAKLKGMAQRGVRLLVALEVQRSLEGRAEGS